MVSCSNDTTIKVWRLKQLDEYLHAEPKVSKFGKKYITQQGPFSTLSDHSDYVRAIDFARQKGSLFSVSDDGQLFMWDLSAEKLMQKYMHADDQQASMKMDNRIHEESKEEEKIPEHIREEEPVVSHHIDIFERACCPAAMASSPQGNLVFVSYTDNTVQMFDIR